jgi:DnaJ domain
MLMSDHDFSARSQGAPMTTLYDLLGVRPDVADETLKAAFREAAKANHPDLHPDDPDASMRFGRIGSAYAILRDAEKRAAYDRLLELEREQLRPMARWTVSHTMNSFVFPVIAVAGLAIVLPAGYTLFAHISNSSIEAPKVVGVFARAPSTITVVHDMTDRDERDDRLGGVEIPYMTIVPSAEAPTADDASGIPRIADGGPALSSAESEAEVDKIVNLAFGPLPDARTIIDDVKRNDRIQLLDQNGAPPPVGDQSSSLERDKGVPKLVTFDLRIADETQDTKTPDMKTSNTKRPDTKTPERSWTVTKRQAPSTLFEQVSLAQDCILSGGLVCAFPSRPSFSQRKRR